MIFEDILQELENGRNPDNVAGMARFGITPARSFGWKMPDLRSLARRIRPKDGQARHDMAAQLWAVDSRETRILASLIDDPKQVTPAQMDAWAADFDYWEICDQCCMNLFEKTNYAFAKALEWSEAEAEYAKRAGFVLMARLAVSDKKATDAQFEPFLVLIEQEADDPRDMVKKGVSWALRQIGKRNRTLHEKAEGTAVSIAAHPHKSARWIAQDALKELNSEMIINRLK
jgi:3-methyladenine DNA glycosylase AlkD